VPPPPSGQPTSAPPTPWHTLGGAPAKPTATPRTSPSNRSSPSSTPSRRPKPSATPKKSAAAVVTAYISAINRHSYATAWAIYHLAAKGQTYSSFVAGFRGTDHDQLTITGTSGSTVHIDLVAYQTDRSRRHYAGTYTVRGGRITAAHLSVAG
jgi:hypothetical protein